MFPVETLKGIQQSAVDAAQLQPLAIEDPRNYHFRLGDNVARVPIPAPLRQFRIETIEDLVRLATSEGRGAVFPVIWHDDSRVVLVLDADDRRETAALELIASRQFRFAALLDKSGPHRCFEQRELVRVLRLELGVDEAVVVKFRRLDWQNGGVRTGTVGRGKESLGSEITAQVQRIEEIPEQIAVDMPVYTLAEPETVLRVRFAVEIDAPNQTIELAPLPNEIISVMTKAQVILRGYIDGLVQSMGGGMTVPVYNGRP